VRGYHLPGAHVRTERFRVGSVDVDVPRLAPAELRAIADAGRGAAVRYLRSRSLDDVLTAIDRVVANWLTPTEPVRHLANALLPKATGFSPAMIAHGLPLLLQPLRADAIRALLESEVGARRANAPTLTMHVLSGNIPGLGAAPMVFGLALGSAALIKSAAADPLFPALFAGSVSAVDGGLGQCLAVTYWRGGDPIEDVAFAVADLVVASGSDAAIAALAARVPGRFIGYGHRVSFAAIGAECLGDTAVAGRLARRLAYDISLWDQHGCLSPQLCYVEPTGRIAPAHFAELLAEALAQYAVELPPRRLSLEEQTAVLGFRQETEWSDATTLLASSGTTEWSISLHSAPVFLPTCLNRCVRLAIIEDLRDLGMLLGPHRRFLEGAGLAVGANRYAALAEMLARSGVHHVSAIGRMQLPSLAWRQGGLPRIGAWVE